MTFSPVINSFLLFLSSYKENFVRRKFIKVTGFPYGMLFLHGGLFNVQMSVSKTRVSDDIFYAYSRGLVKVAEGQGNLGW